MASTNNVPLDPSLDPANLPTLSPCLLQPMIGEDAGDFWQQTELGFYVPNYLYPPPTQSAFYPPQQPLPSPSPEEEFPPSIPLPSPTPLRDAMNLPREPLPSKQASAEYTQPEKVSVHDPVLTPQPAASENRETVNKKTTKPRAVIGGRDLLQIGRAVVKLKPFLAGHGDVGKLWKAVNQHLRDNGFRHEVASSTIQSKAHALVAFKKDPTCEEARSVVSHIKDDVAVLIASTLEQMEQQWDDAKDKSDAAKQEFKEKTEADAAAGERIRAKSMIARKRRRSVTPPPKDDTDDEAGDASGSSAGGPSAEGSFNDSEGSKKKTTKKRKTDRRTDPPAVAELTQLLKADMDERREYNKENNALMHKYLDDVNDGRKEMMGLLAKLLSSDRN
ncbi:hypothetical protein R3P38DRAFT_3481387 [Favolaschia claudopus]|uniref:Uncharacterized protein n=1 Tax=Favolaschia claudopus TaxID=2862362 RepID=A0AAV9Z9W7_9AGAR